MSFKTISEFLALKGDHAPTVAERRLIEAVQANRPCFLCDPRNPQRPIEAKEETQVRAELLRLIIIERANNFDKYFRGIALTGAWIHGLLDLAFCEIGGQTILSHCSFSAPLNFNQSQFGSIEIRNCYLSAGFFAPGIKVNGNLTLSDSISAGPISVAHARIQGQAIFNNTQLDGGRSLRGAQQSALNAQSTEVGLGLFLDGISAVGTIVILGSQIEGPLSLIGARLHGGKDEKGADLRALNAQRMFIGDGLFLRGASAFGTIDVNGSTVNGEFDFSGSSCDGGLNSDGVANKSLNASHIRVKAAFNFRQMGSIRGRIALDSASVGDLVDEMDSWPLTKDQLLLNGFTYERISGTAPANFAARRNWLFAGSNWQGDFFPQPYTQLARVLRQMGHSNESRLALIEREALLAEHKLLGDRAAYQKALNGDQIERSDAGWIWLRIMGFQTWISLTRIIAGYGYAPQRALYCAFVCVGVSFLAYFFFWRLGAMVPADSILLVSPGWTDAVSANPTAPSHVWQGPAATHYETFYSLAYALDVFLPIVDLGQQSKWSQTTATWWGWLARLYTWGLQVTGYVVTTLGAAAATGIIQRNQPD